MRLSCLALLLGAVGCEVGQAISDEIEGNVRDHGLKVTPSQPWVLVGGSGAATVSDGCTPQDFQDCEYQTVTLEAVTTGGSIARATFVGTSISFGAEQLPGTGTLSVTGLSGTSTGSGSGTISVIGPDEVRVEPRCGREAASAPFLASAGHEVTIGWTYYVGGQPAFGETGQVHAQAEGFELVAKSGPSARFTTPAQPGTVPVFSTVGSSTFDYELYDAATALLAPLAVTDEMMTYRDRFIVDAFTLVGGREACVDAPKTLRSDSPAICLIEEDETFVESIDTQRTKIPVMALQPGTCSISATHPATAQVASLQFEVDPVALEDRGWDAICEGAPGTTCGVTCPRINCWTPTGCEVSVTGTTSCLHSLDPEDTDPECADTTGNEASTGVREILCWPTPASP